MVSKLVNKEIVAQLIGFLISCIWDRKLLSKIGDNGGSFVYGCLRVGGFDLLKIIDIGAASNSVWQPNITSDTVLVDLSLLIRFLCYEPDIMENN